MGYTIKIEPPKAFLEEARSLLGTKILKPSNDPIPDDAEVPSNIIFASIAQTYIFSYLAVLAFATENISGIWRDDNDRIREMFPNAKNLDHLLNSDLKEIKELLKTICYFHNIKPINDEEPDLWNEFMQVVKVTRDFFSHPIPDEHKFDKIVGEVFAKRSWRYASSVAENIISYFYKKKNLEVPDWVKENQDFKIETIRALRIAPSSKTA